MDISTKVTRPTETGRLQLLLAYRLRRSLKMKKHARKDSGPEAVELVDHAIFADYCDLRELLGPAIAQAVIDDIRQDEEW